MGQNGTKRRLIGSDHNIWGADMAGKHNGADRSQEWNRLKEAQRQAVERKAAEGERLGRDIAAVATPQTIRKRQVDVVQLWQERGKLGVEQVQAAQEILRVWEATTRGLWARTQTYERHARSADVADWPAKLRRAYVERYRPWDDEACRMAATPQASVKELVLAVVVDNQGPDGLARRYGMDHKRASVLVQESLYRYAQLAGWYSGPSVPEATATLMGLIATRERMMQKAVDARPD